MREVSYNQYSFSLPKDIQVNKGWIIALGILQLVLGFVALTFVGITSILSVIYLGALFMVGGISEALFAFGSKKSGGFWFHIMFGVLTAVCGFFVLMNPIANLVVLTVLIAALFITTGLVSMIGAIVERFPNWGWFAFSGLISTVAGVLIFYSPLESSLWLIGFLVGLHLIFRGLAWLSLIGLASSMKKAGY